MKKYNFAFKALWTNCQICVIRENNNWLNKIINFCYQEILDFENNFSRFKPDSILSLLNQTKALEVNKDFLDLLEKSKEIYDLTLGFFNPLIDLRNIWYSNSFWENNFEIEKHLENLDFSNIKIIEKKVFLDENMNLDFWSIAKWFLADKLWLFLKSKWIYNFLVNMWWDIVVSWVNLDNKPWNIAISNPFLEKEIIYNLALENKSVSTSWIYLRKWEIDNKNYHHIRNPFSNKQETLLKSVTIVWDFWYKTDALATSVIAMWYEKGLEFCKKNNLSYLFILENWEIVKSSDL